MCLQLFKSKVVVSHRESRQAILNYALHESGGYEMEISRRQRVLVSIQINTRTYQVRNPLVFPTNLCLRDQNVNHVTLTRSQDNYGKSQRGEHEGPREEAVGLFPPSRQKTPLTGRVAVGIVAGIEQTDLPQRFPHETIAKQKRTRLSSIERAYDTTH